MTTTTGTDTASIAARILDLTEHIEKLTAARDAAKAQLRALGVGNHPAGAHTVQIQPNRRFDADLAQTHVPDVLLKQCQKTVIDAAAVKQLVAPALYEQCMREVGDPKVLVK